MNVAKPMSVVGLADAVEAIRGLARGVEPSALGIVVVGVCGPVCSGKSTLAGMLGGSVVATDDYLPEYHLIPDDERDLPERADLTRLAADLAGLRTHGRASVPVWSFKSHRREGERWVHVREGLVVCEGIHALHERVRSVLDVRVFMEAPGPQRLRRCEDRERSGVRGWTVELAREHFTNIAEPTFERYAGDYRSAAHVIVSNPDGGQCENDRSRAYC